MKKFLAVILSLCLMTVLLAACGGGGGSAPEQTKAYIALVVDENDAPVEGVSVQLCSDEMCVVGDTDATGIAEFEVEEGTYTIHILKVPEGFAEDSTEYEVPETYGVIPIVLKAAE